MLLADVPGRELVLGIAGRFWSVTGGGMRVSADDFATFAPPDTARAALDFRFECLAGGNTRVTTETRITCSDERARRRFAAYWRIVRPGSGLIRREILRRLRARAEG